jgi:hypothetical protein
MLPFSNDMVCGYLHLALPAGFGKRQILANRLWVFDIQFFLFLTLNYIAFALED